MSSEWKELVLSFPALWRVRESPPLEAEALDKWAGRMALGPGAMEAVRFVLDVWDPYRDWKVGSFDLWRAVKVWDSEQKAAFAKWAQKQVGA